MDFFGGIEDANPGGITRRPCYLRRATNELVSKRSITLPAQRFAACVKNPIYKDVEMHAKLDDRILAEIPIGRLRKPEDLVQLAVYLTLVCCEVMREDICTRSSPRRTAS